jgi:hypothetical protein
MHLVAEAPTERRNRSKKPLLLALALFAGSVSEAWADAAETLQGAWVQESSDCTQVFEKVQGQIQFKDRNYALDMGFIISGSKAKGPAGGVCTLSQVDEENDHFSAVLSCSDGLVSRDFPMSFRIVDATHFERFDPARRDPTIRYKKCRLD